MQIVYLSAEPAPGKEMAYWIAWKHRVYMMRLYDKTPWWQFRKKNRRWNKALNAITRTYDHGQDVVIEFTPPI